MIMRKDAVPAPILIEINSRDRFEKGFIKSLPTSLFKRGIAAGP